MFFISSLRKAVCKGFWRFLDLRLSKIITKPGTGNYVLSIHISLFNHTLGSKDSDGRVDFGPDIKMLEVSQVLPINQIRF